MLYKSSGTLVYSPKTKDELKSSNDWAIVSCAHSIGQYYRALYHQEFFYKPKLIQPIWSSHISFIRNEKINNPSLWRFAENKVINFEYEPGVKNNNKYFWLTVYCDELLAIRELYGLNREPKYGLHLTIGIVSNN